MSLVSHGMSCLKKYKLKYSTFDLNNVTLLSTIFDKLVIKYLI